MKPLREMLKKRKFEANALAFALMILPPVPLFFAAQNGAAGAVWALLGLVVLGNLLAIAIR